MPDLLKTASAWLEQQRTQHLTELVTYRRDADAVSLPATIGKTLFEVDDGHGIVQRIESRDFLILADDLELNGDVVLPERGDIIEESAGALSLQYEVTAPANEPCWRYSDPYRQTLRIHTKQIGTVEG